MNNSKLLLSILIMGLVLLITITSYIHLEKELYNVDKLYNEVLIDLEYNKGLVDIYQDDLEFYKNKSKELEYEVKIFREKKDKPNRGTTITSKGLEIEFEATAYCPCTKCCGANAKGITASGTKVKEGRTIAVDPKVIPLGSRVLVNGKEYVAEDVGSAIKGNIVDIFFNNHSEALKFGRQKVKVEILERGD